ncbi:hypothetical protein [Brevibacillus sp. NRS-1366]|uniref:hypothetical protein n=1 Tax=Brevibacillus sp. NRS-1366 TaxID=3233899 RepID=UPI003D1A2EBA
MKKSTDYYIRLHASYLAGMDDRNRQEELAAYETVYDHMYDFFRRLDLSHDQALSVIDDFRTDMLVDGIRQASH